MAQAGQGDGLVRWLIGGLVVGGIVLGLMVGAYEIGVHHGRDERPQALPPTTTTTTAPKPQAAGSSTAAGERLFTADACAGCHSLDGSAGAGPTVKGLA